MSSTDVRPSTSESTNASSGPSGRMRMSTLRRCGVPSNGTKIAVRAVVRAPTRSRRSCWPLMRSLHATSAPRVHRSPRRRKARVRRARFRAVHLVDATRATVGSILRPIPLGVCPREVRVVLGVLRVEALVDAALAFADRERDAVARAAVDEAVRDARSRDEAHDVPRAQRSFAWRFSRLDDAHVALALEDV